MVREGVVVFLGTLARHLPPGDPKRSAVIETLVGVLGTPSEVRHMAVHGGTKMRLRHHCSQAATDAPAHCSSPIHSAQAVQRSVSLCLPPLIQPMATDREYVEALVARLLAMLTKGATYGERCEGEAGSGAEVER